MGLDAEVEGELPEDNENDGDRSVGDIDQDGDVDVKGGENGNDNENQDGENDNDMQQGKEMDSDLQPAHRAEALDILAVIEFKWAQLREHRRWLHWLGRTCSSKVCFHGFLLLRSSLSCVLYRQSPGGFIYWKNAQVAGASVLNWPAGGACMKWPVLGRGNAHKKVLFGVGGRSVSQFPSHRIGNSCFAVAGDTR